MACFKNSRLNLGFWRRGRTIHNRTRQVAHLNNDSFHGRLCLYQSSPQLVYFYIASRFFVFQQHVQFGNSFTIYSRNWSINDNNFPTWFKLRFQKGKRKEDNLRSFNSWRLGAGSSIVEDSFSFCSKGVPLTAVTAAANNSGLKTKFWYSLSTFKVEYCGLIISLSLDFLKTYSNSYILVNILQKQILHQPYLVQAGKIKRKKKNK